MRGKCLALGVTLARGGSKGIPHKNIAPLNGKPVLWYTLDAADKSKYLNDHVVSSDDPAILQVARDFGAIALHRPSFLAQDTTPTLPALVHAVSTLEEMLNVEFEYIVELRATNPLKTTEDIDNCINLLIESNADSVIGVTECQEFHPGRVKYLEDGYIKDFYPEPESGRRQDLTPTAYVRNGSIYAFPRRSIMGENPKLFGHKRSIGYVMPAERSINLDRPIDLILAEALMKRNMV